jgi:hypothetical protein
MSPTKNNPKIKLDMKNLTLENLHEYISEESKKIRDHAKGLAIDHAESSLPNPSQDSLEKYLLPIKRSFISLWTEIETKFLDSSSVGRLAEMEMAQGEKFNKMNEDEILSTKNLLNEVNEKLYRVSNTYNWKMFGVIILAFALLVGLEAIFNSQWLQQLAGVTYDEAKLIALFIYFLLFVAIMWFYSKIQSTSSTALRNVYRALFFLIIGGFLAYTSYARTVFVNDSFDLITFLGVFTINLLTFMGMLHLHKFLPSKEQIDTMMYQREYRNKKKELEKQLDSLKGNVKQQAVRNAELVKGTQQTLITLEKNKKYLESQFQLAISHYTETNARYRLDRLTPNCFLDEIQLNLN